METLESTDRVEFNLRLLREASPSSSSSSPLYRRHGFQLQLQIQLLFLLALHLFVAFLPLSSSLNVTDSTWEVSSGSYFGEEIKVAVLRTEFDNDVFLVDNLVCPRPFDWKPPKPLKDTDCLPCNYAVKDKGVCGTSRLKKEEGGGSSSKCKSECDEDTVRLYCGGSTREEWVNNAGTHIESRGDFKEDKKKRKKKKGGRENTNYDLHNTTHFGSFPSPNDWTEVIAGVEIKDRIAETGKSHFFRYYHSDPEVGFRVEVRTKYGSTNLYLSTTVPLPSRFEWDIINPTPVGPLSQIVCPNFASWELGTWFISVQATVSTSYDLLILKEMKPKGPLLQEPKKCLGPKEEYQYCITDGETLEGVDSTYGVYYATECKPVAFSLTSQQGDYDLYLSFSDPLTEDGSYDLVGYLFGDDRMTLSICPHDNGTPRPIYFQVQSFVQDKFQFTVTSDSSAILSCPLVDYPVPTIQYDMVSVASMKCGKDINKCSYPLYTCDIWWPVWPSSEPIPFFPPPPCVKTRPSFEFVKTFKPKPKFISYNKDKTQTNVFYSALLMSQLNGNNVLYDEEGVAQCELQFWGRLVDKEGLPYFGAVTFGYPKSSACNSKEFIAINEHIVRLVNEMRESDDQTATLESRFLLETYLRLPSYSSCAKGIDGLYFDSNESRNGTLITTKVNTTACLNTDASSKKYAKDPCCNTIEAGANKACRPRPQEIHIPRYVPDEKKVREACSTAPCAELVLVNMIEVVQQLALENGASCGKNLSVQDLTVPDYGTIEVLDIYIKCKNQALGDFSVGFDCANSLETPGCFGYKRPKGTRGGVSCWVDEDCPGHWKCDIKNRICQIPREVKEKKLVECLVEKLPSFVLSPLLLKYDLPTDKPQEAVEEIKKAWLATDCVEATDFALQKRETWFYDVFDPRIYELYNSFEIPCTTSVRLDQISETLGDTCRDTYDFGSWYVTASTEYLCMKDGEYCNWVDCKKEGFSETECRKSCEVSSGSSEDSFCGLCFNDEECNVFSSFNSKEQCEEQEVCVLPNGDIVETTKEECENLGQCTEPCSNDGKKCTSKSECEKKGGTCSGWQYFEEPSAPVELKGACFSSFMTYDDAALAFTSVTVGAEQNSAIAALCKQQSQYTPIGCIRYNLPTKEKCKEKKEKQKDKKEGLKGPKHWVWISKPEGKDECLQYEQCKQRLINRRDFLITRYNEKDESDCKFVGGKYGSVFDWTEGRWLKAKMMPLKWTKKSFGNHFAWKPTLNFSLIASDLLNALEFSLGTEATTDATCRYSQVPLLRNSLLCHCSVGLDYNKTTDKDISDSSSCSIYDFRNSNIAPTSPQAVLYVCEDIATTVTQLGFTLDFRKETVTQGCDIVYVDLVPVYQFEEPTDVRISSSIIPMPSYKEFSVVYNEKGFVVGQLLGDGLRIEHDKELKNLTLCFRVSLEREEHDFHVIDIGRKQKGNTFLPFGLTGYSTKETERRTVCILVPTLKPCNGESRCTIMPIKRRKDFKWIDNHYDTWERGLMFTLAGLYFLVCLLTLFQVAYIQLNPNMTLLLHHIVQAAIFVIALMRGLFFVLVPTISWFQDNDIAEFSFIVVPTLIQLSLFILNVLVWAINTMGLKVKFKWPFIISNAVLWLMFIVLIILFVTLPTKVSNNCNGRRPTEQDQTTQEVVKIIFFITLMVIASILLLGLFIFGKFIFRAFEKSNTLLKIFSLAFLIAISVIITTLYLVLIAFLSIESVPLTFSLFVCVEIIPFLALCYILKPRKEKRSPKAIQGLGATGRGSSANITFTSSTSHTSTNTSNSVSDPRFSG